MKHLLLILAISTLSINAKATVYNQSGYDNIYSQMDNYFQNPYWTSSWQSFSSWFPDVLENGSQREVARGIIQKDYYATMFDDLNAQKTKSPIDKFWDSLFWDMHDELEGIRNPGEDPYEAPLTSDSLVLTIIAMQVVLYTFYKKRKKDLHTRKQN